MLARERRTWRQEVLSFVKHASSTQITTNCTPWWQWQGTFSSDIWGNHCHLPNEWQRFGCFRLAWSCPHPLVLRASGMTQLVSTDYVLSHSKTVWSDTYQERSWTLLSYKCPVMVWKRTDKPESARTWDYSENYGQAFAQGWAVMLFIFPIHAQSRRPSHMKCLSRTRKEQVVYDSERRESSPISHWVLSPYKMRTTAFSLQGCPSPTGTMVCIVMKCQESLPETRRLEGDMESN